MKPSTTPDGYLFGKYEVGKLLGCGAFAKVYHARMVRTGQSVAIKVISKQKVLKGNLTAHVKRAENFSPKSLKDVSLKISVVNI